MLMENTMMTNLLFPMLAHVLWLAILYSLLTLYRAPAVWGVAVSEQVRQHCKRIEPRISANLSNQFEWPMLFYVACLFGVILKTDDFLLGVLAWTFVVGRLLHSCVQIGMNNIRLRGLVFTINFLAVLAMWLRLAWIA